MDVSASVRAGMQETNDRFCREAIKRGDLSALERVYTRGAKVLPPGAPVIEGMEAIKGFWAQAAGLGIAGVTLTTVSAEMCGDGVVEIGLVDLTMKDGAVMKAKYVVHWKQEDGGWRWDKDIWNAS